MRKTCEHKNSSCDNYIKDVVFDKDIWYQDENGEWKELSVEDVEQRLDWAENGNDGQKENSFIKTR